MTYYKKKKTIKYFPKDYEGFKVIKSFRKKRSPRTRLFVCGDPDGWFIDSIEIKTRTGEVVDDEGWITERQVEDRSKWYNSLGWLEEITNS
ncbi:hypothetical protein KY334_06245 [Candidatus Woesearchaeota archaeon]|nr:hypothetical protein [Candidatus Woesearchaeota archaeon]